MFFFVYLSYILFSLLQELLVSVGSLEFSGGKAEIADVSNCSGDVSFIYFFLIFLFKFLAPLRTVHIYSLFHNYVCILRIIVFVYAY